VPLSGVQSRNRHILQEDFSGHIDDREVMAFEKEADAERIRRIAEPSFQDGLMVDGPGDMNGLVELSEKM
jgi:hypothetical protein